MNKKEAAAYMADMDEKSRHSKKHVVFDPQTISGMSNDAMAILLALAQINTVACESLLKTEEGRRSIAVTTGRLLAEVMGRANEYTTFCLEEVKRQAEFRNGDVGGFVLDMGITIAVEVAAKRGLVDLAEELAENTTVWQEMQGK